MMKKTNKKLWNFLYEQEPFELVFDIPAKEAARRLSAHIHKYPFTGAFTERVTGDVSIVTGIRLQRVIPLSKNPARPVMVGTFQEENGKTKLTGIFRLHRCTQGLTTLWLGFLALSIIVEFIKILTTAHELSSTFWVMIFFFLFGIFIIKISKWYVKLDNDKEWLIAKVTAAIREA